VSDAAIPHEKGGNIERAALLPIKNKYKSTNSDT
jgi:hypothetical protein